MKIILIFLIEYIFIALCAFHVSLVSPSPPTKSMKLTESWIELISLQFPYHAHLAKLQKCGAIPNLGPNFGGKFGGHHPRDNFRKNEDDKYPVNDDNDDLFSSSRLQSSSESITSILSKVVYQSETHSHVLPITYFVALNQSQFPLSYFSALRLHYANGNELRLLWRQLEDDDNIAVTELEDWSCEPLSIWNELQVLSLFTDRIREISGWSNVFKSPSVFKSYMFDIEICVNVLTNIRDHHSIVGGEEKVKKNRIIAHEMESILVEWLRQELRQGVVASCKGTKDGADDSNHKNRCSEYQMDYDTYSKIFSSHSFAWYRLYTSVKAWVDAIFTQQWAKYIDDLKIRRSRAWKISSFIVPEPMMTGARQYLSQTLFLLLRTQLTLTAGSMVESQIMDQSKAIVCLANATVKNLVAWAHVDDDFFEVNRFRVVVNISSSFDLNGRIVIAETHPKFVENNFQCVDEEFPSKEEENRRVESSNHSLFPNYNSIWRSYETNRFFYSVPLSFTPENLAEMGSGGSFNQVQFYCFPVDFENWAGQLSHTTGQWDITLERARLLARASRLFAGTALANNASAIVESIVSFLSSEHALHYRPELYSERRVGRVCRRSRDIDTHYINLAIGLASSFTNLLNSSGPATSSTISLRSLKSDRFRFAGDWFSNVSSNSSYHEQYLAATANSSSRAWINSTICRPSSGHIPQFLVIGLGAGQMAEYYLDHHSCAAITNVEIDASVWFLSSEILQSQAMFCSVNRNGSVLEGVSFMSPRTVDGQLCRSQIVLADCFQFIATQAKNVGPNCNAAATMPLGSNSTQEVGETRVEVSGDTYYDLIVIDVFDYHAAIWVAEVGTGTSNFRGDLSASISHLERVRNLLRPLMQLECDSHVEGMSSYCDANDLKQPKVVHSSERSIALFYMHCDADYVGFLTHAKRVFGARNIALLSIESASIIVASRDGFSRNSVVEVSSELPSDDTNNNVSWHPCDDIDGFHASADAFAEYHAHIGMTKEYGKYTLVC